MDQIRKQRLFGVKAIADYLGITEWAVRSLVKRGRIPVVRRSGYRRILFDIIQIDAWIERNTLKEIKN